MKHQDEYQPNPWPEQQRYCGPALPRVHTPRLEDIKHLERRWLHTPKERKPAKDALAVVGGGNFSPAFESQLCEANFVDIYGLEDYGILVAIFECLVECEAIRQFRADSNHNLARVVAVARVTLSTTPDGTPRWNKNSWKAEYSTLVDLISHLFTIPRMDALATLADIVGLSFENITRLTLELFFRA